MGSSGGEGSGASWVSAGGSEMGSCWDMKLVATSVSRVGAVGQEIPCRTMARVSAIYISAPKEFGARNGDIRIAVAMQKLESVENDRMRAGDPEMANSPDSAVQNVIPMYELKWSHDEKTVARRAFDLALGKELKALLQEAKGRAARIKEPSKLWDLESWLTERRREIDRRYDYRYSILPFVFAQLLRNGRLTEDDLHGLGQEKLDLIRRASAI